MLHVFQAESAESVESKHLARTLYRLAGYQFGTGLCIIGVFSPCGARKESKLVPVEIQSTWIALIT